jgi:uncharacterized protein (TIGR02594 family)
MESILRWIKEFFEKLFQVDKKLTKEKEVESIKESYKEPVIENLNPYQIAKSEIGQKEVGGPQHNSRIVEYHQTVSLKAKTDEVAWCSSFVNWCFLKANLSHLRSGSSMARSWLKFGAPVLEKDVKEGDVVIFWRDKLDGPYGHVGFVVKVGSTTVSVLGGNQSNAVNVTKYLKSRVLGYRRFPYNSK